MEPITIYGGHPIDYVDVSLPYNDSKFIKGGITKSTSKKRNKTFYKKK